MKNGNPRRFVSCLLVLAAAGCVTVNVYFPEAAVKSLSERIEEAVAREAAEGTAAAPSGGAQASVPFAWVGVLLAALPAPTVHAAEGDRVPEPEITNPAIRTIISSRASRLGEVNAWKDRGVLGESKEALLEIRGLEGVDLPDRAKVQKLVRAENEDRQRMFREIAAATGVDLSQLPKIQATYAATLREKARPGDWIEQPDGTWTRKR